MVLLVDPRRVDEIAEAMSYLVEHPDEAREMGERGRAAVRDRLNWRVEQRELIRLYRRLAIRPGALDEAPMC